MFNFENPFGKKDKAEQPLPPKPISQAEKFFEKPACFSATIASEGHPDRNEDDFFVNQENGLFGVFDGVGGERDGAEASRIAKDLVTEFLKYNLSDDNLEQIKESLRESLVIANNRLTEQTAGKTTASVVKIWEDPIGAKKAIIGNVGDSRVYVLRNGQLSQLTIDDNIVRQRYKNNNEAARQVQKRLNNTVDAQRLTADEVLLFNNRNVIYNFLGQKDFNPNIMVFDLLPGDEILLCSDGVSDNLTDLQIEGLLKESVPTDPAKKLIDQALMISRQGQARSKLDDMTAVVVELSDHREKMMKSKDHSENQRLKHLKIGTSVKVQRSSGKIESGWTIGYFEDGYYLVYKKNGLQILDKRVKQADLEKINLSKELSLEELERDIRVAGTTDEILSVLGNISGLQGSQRFYTSNELCEMIKKISVGELSINYLPRTAGLREKVISLIK